jgi:hypothetical protein
MTVARNPYLEQRVPPAPEASGGLSQVTSRYDDAANRVIDGITFDRNQMYGAYGNIQRPQLGGYGDNDPEYGPLVLKYQGYSTDFSPHSQQLVESVLGKYASGIGRDKLDDAAYQTLQNHIKKYGTGYQHNSDPIAIAQEIMQRADPGALAKFQASPDLDAYSKASTQLREQASQYHDAKSDEDDGFGGFLSMALPIGMMFIPGMQGLAGSIGSALGASGAVATGIGAGAMTSGLSTALRGGDFGDIVKNSVVGGGLGGIGGAASNYINPSTVGAMGPLPPTALQEALGPTGAKLLANVGATAAKGVASGQGVDFDKLIQNAAGQWIDSTTGIPVSTAVALANRPDRQSGLTQVANNQRQPSGGGNTNQYWRSGGGQQNYEQFGSALGNKKGYFT